MLKADTRESFLEALPNFTADQAPAYSAALDILLTKSSGSADSEADKSTYSKAYMRKIQVLLEKKMSLSIANSTPFYDKDLYEILRFSFLASDKGLIEAHQPFVILEDIYDCLSINEIQSYFEFLEDLVKSLTNISALQQQALLRIGIGILKKFSKVHENEFRGRVQLFLAKITSIVFETAVNLKSTLNTSNQTTYDSNPDALDSMGNFGTEKSRVIASRISFSFYQKFWELQKFLHNPGLLFNAENSILVDEEEANEDGEINTKPKQGKKTGPSKVDAFCRLIVEAVDLFKSDPVIENEDVLYERRYPKYFTKFSLLSTQLRDPNFRKTWICQVIICLWSIKNPIKIKGVKQFEVGEKDLEKLTGLENTVTDYAKSLRDNKEDITFYEKLTLFLERERKWLKWKEDGCKTFEKPIKPPSLSDKIQTIKDKAPRIEDIIARGQPSSKHLSSDELRKLRKTTGFDTDHNLFVNIKSNNFPASEEPIEPSVEYYFNTFLTEYCDETLTDSDRLSSSELEAWRSIRILSRYNIAQLFTTLKDKEQAQKTDFAELMVNDILKKMKPADAPVKEEDTKVGSVAKLEEEKNDPQEPQGDTAAKEETEAKEDADNKEEVVEIKPQEFLTTPARSDVVHNEGRSELKIEVKDEPSERKSLEQLKAEAMTPIKDGGMIEKDKPAKEGAKSKLNERLERFKVDRERAAEENKDADKNGHDEKNGKKSPSNGKRPADEDIVEIERPPSESKKTKSN